MGGDHKRASERRLDHLRALRSEHGIPRRPVPDAAAATGADAGPTIESPEPVTPPPVPPPPMAERHTRPKPEPETVDIAQVKYEMELADHRQTMARLLAEKDQTIDALRELVTELRTQLDHERSRHRAPSRTESEPNTGTRAAARPLFDFTDDRKRKPE